MSFLKKEDRYSEVKSVIQEVINISISMKHNNFHIYESYNTDNVRVNLSQQIYITIKDSFELRYFYDVYGNDYVIKIFVNENDYDRDEFNDIDSKDWSYILKTSKELISSWKKNLPNSVLQ